MTHIDEQAAEADRYLEYQAIDTGYRAVRWHEKTLYEQSRPGSTNAILPPVEPGIVALVGDVAAALPAAACSSSGPAIWGPPWPAWWPESAPCW